MIENNLSVKSYQIPDLFSQKWNDLVDDFPKISTSNQVLKVNVDIAESGIDVQ